MQQSPIGSKPSSRLNGYMNNNLPVIEEDDGSYDISSTKEEVDFTEIDKELSNELDELMSPSND